MSFEKYPDGIFYACRPLSMKHTGGPDCSCSPFITRSPIKSLKEELLYEEAINLYADMFFVKQSKKGQRLSEYGKPSFGWRKMDKKNEQLLISREQTNDPRE
jgi:hypothetical protein